MQYDNLRQYWATNPQYQFSYSQYPHSQLSYAQYQQYQLSYIQPQYQFNYSQQPTNCSSLLVNYSDYANTYKAEKPVSNTNYNLSKSLISDPVSFLHIKHVSPQSHMQTEATPAKNKTDFSSLSSSGTCTDTLANLSISEANYQNTSIIINGSNNSTVTTPAFKITIFK